jgi:hypothetical protein
MHADVKLVKNAASRLLRRRAYELGQAVCAVSQHPDLRRLGPTVGLQRCLQERLGIAQTVLCDSGKIGA